MGKQSNAAKAAKPAAAVAVTETAAPQADAPVVAPAVEASSVVTPAAPPVIDPPAGEAPPTKKKGATIALDEFITKHEEASQAQGLVVTAISHPDAPKRHHDGVYSGFPITPGDLSATYSDGSTN